MLDSGSFRDTRKDPKLEDKKKVEDKSKVGDKNKSPAIRPAPLNEAAGDILHDASGLVDDSTFQYRSLAKRMDTMEEAMRDLTSLVAKIYDTLNKVRFFCIRCAYSFFVTEISVFPIPLQLLRTLVRMTLTHFTLHCAVVRRMVSRVKIKMSWHISNEILTHGIQNQRGTT